MTPETTPLSPCRDPKQSVYDRGNRARSIGSETGHKLASIRCMIPADPTPERVYGVTPESVYGVPHTTPRTVYDMTPEWPYARPR